MKSFKHTHASGFSLIEVLVAIFLVAIAVASLIATSGSLTQANGAGAELSTAEFLIEQIRGLTDLLPVIDPESGIDVFGAEEGSLANYDDVDDFDNTSFNPPITSDRETLNDFSAYTQQVTVENINQNDFQDVVADHSSNFVRITVKALLNSNEISSSSWIRANY